MFDSLTLIIIIKKFYQFLFEIEKSLQNKKINKTDAVV